MVYSSPENLSYSATRGSRLASLVFLVCKCLIIQGGSMIGLRWQSKRTGYSWLVFCVLCSGGGVFWP